MTRVLVLCLALFVLSVTARTYHIDHLLQADEATTPPANDDSDDVFAPADEGTNEVAEESASQGSGRIHNCDSRHGLGESFSLGPDCTQTPDGDMIKQTFPMKSFNIDFPCHSEHPFAKPPIVLGTILGPDKNKLYGVSVRNVTTTSFAVNVQRTDDVTEPDMECDNIYLNYFAIVL